MMRFILVALCATTFLAAPHPSFAASFEVAGWIPYWAADAGMQEASAHFSTLTTIYPFSYSVTRSGAVKDVANMQGDAWKRFTRQAKVAGIAVIPTVMWSDTENIHSVLSDPSKRAEHIQSIISMVEEGKYSGVDIDYEGKVAKTRPHFSSFLRELKVALRGAILSCTIEPRTPPESLYITVPDTLEYANDYDEINRYCDRVNIMTYDQQRADRALNEVNSGAPYYPVADTAWVSKVLDVTLASIAKDKVLVGIPTYGRELAITVSPNWFQTYKQLSAVSHGYAVDTAQTYGVKPYRNSAGELSYSYIPTSVSKKLLSDRPLSERRAGGDEVALQALAYANTSGKPITIRTVWWSDGAAIKDKVTLARARGVRGVAIFKLDGKADPLLWNAF